MTWPAFPSLSLTPSQAALLFGRLSAGRQVWGVQSDGDGYCRLQPWLPQSLAMTAEIPFLSLKKFLLPPAEPLWHCNESGYAVPLPPALLLTGVALCDLQALSYLDRVFAEDELYRARRGQLLVVGAPCKPSDTCACQAAGLYPGGDLFWNGEHLWGLSSCGESILAATCSELAPTLRPLPGPLLDKERTEITAARFSASAELPLWHEEAARCVSCGACSAVCPTCCCYEVIDRAWLDGSVTRLRVWDNCFFTDHGRVAGGFDFRPNRGQRLRFRFEHKRLGFGALRGIASCVGCGRCRRACPVDIDLEPIAVRLAEWRA